MSFNVAVVDDEVHIRKILEMKLAGNGYSVAAYCDAASALEGICNDPPDLIITDMRMPGNMDGVGLIMTLRQHRNCRYIPIILLSGSVAVLNRLQAAVADVDNISVIPKPFSPREILQQVNSTFDEQVSATSDNE